MSTKQDTQCDCCGSAATDTGQADDSEMTCYCPVDDILSVVAKKYGIQIVGLLENHGSMRTGEIRDAIGITSSATLSTRLDELEEAGLIDREQFDEIPPRVEYTLTPEGRELANRLQPLLKWADEN